MALPSTAVWEMQTGGSNTNGGFFYDRDPGTSVDYSQQAAAELSLNDITTDGAGTGVGSVTGGFTAAMKGNGIYLTGGGATAGWYEITAYTDTNTVTIDRSAGANKSGVTGNVGGCLALLTQAIMYAMAGSSLMHVKAGTYTATADVNGYYGSNALIFIGYQTTRGDVPEGDNCPLFAMGAYDLRGASQLNWHNLRVTTTDSTGVYCNTSVVYSNVAVLNNSGTAGRIGFTIQDNPTFHRVDVSSTNGYGVKGTSSRGTYFKNCYIHDCGNRGVYLQYGDEGSYVYDTVVSNCTDYGIYAYDCASLAVERSTIYGCGVGVGLGISAKKALIKNNLIDSCTTGLSAAAESFDRVVDYNNFNGNTADVSNVTKGDNATAHDPDFEDAAAGDFRLKTGSSCLTAGMPITLGTGGNSTTTHQGAVPPVAGGAGASILVHPGTSGGMRG